MANMIDYLAWRGDLTFNQTRLCEVDNELLVFLSFLDFTGIVPEELSDDGISLEAAVEKCLGAEGEKKIYFGALIPSKDIVNMARAMSKARRFRSVKLSGYINRIDIEKEEQFAAYTAQLPDGSVFVSFRGTDDTLVAWKEDLNMSFIDETPAQRSAKEYINSVYEKFGTDIRIGGHSKGGNLAVYSAARCSKEAKERIQKVYNNDGPGFSKAFLESDGYLEIKPKIVKFVPQESVVGMILSNDDNYTVIKSSKFGVDQHNSFLWEVLGKRFVRVPSLTTKSVALNTALNTWIDEKDADARREIADTIYEIFTVSNAKTLTDFNKDKLLLLKSIAKIEPQKREFIFKAFSQLMSEILKQHTAALGVKPGRKDKKALPAEIPSENNPKKDMEIK